MSSTCLTMVLFSLVSSHLFLDLTLLDFGRARYDFHKEKPISCRLFHTLALHLVYYVDAEKYEVVYRRLPSEAYKEDVVTRYG